MLSVVSDRQRDEFSPLSVWPSDVRASLPSNNVEGKNGLPRRRHHPCQPLPVSHRSPVSYFSRRRSWRGRPFCSLAQGHRPYSYSTHDSCRDRCHRRSKRRIWLRCPWQPPYSCRHMWLPRPVWHSWALSLLRWHRLPKNKRSSRRRPVRSPVAYAPLRYW